MMKSINRRSLLYFALAVAAALALYGLSARLAAESGGKTAAFVTDSREIFSLAYQSGKTPADVWREVNALGVAGAAASEFTGDELAMYSSLGVRFGPAAVFTAKLNADAARAVLCWSKNSPYGAQLRSYLERKLPNVGFVEASGNVYALLPGTVEEFKSSALVPDFSVLEFCSANGVNALFRPGPCTPSSGADVAAALDWLTDEYPQIKNIIPAGAILAGYPDVRPIAAFMKAKGITLSQVEFVRQIGVPALARNLGGLVVPMHSLTKEEIISRNISRPTIVDRYVRAVHERSIRFVMVHPYDLQMGGRLDIFLKDLGDYKASLEARGYALGWPQPLPVWPAPLAGAFACGICFVFTLWFYVSRLNGNEKLPVPLSSALALFAASAALGGALWYSSASARLAGGLCGALVATEAALCALESAHSRVRGAVLALLTVVAGGLSIASFYGTSDAALRLTPFSGVKLTLLLPLILIFAHDMKRRVHPEGFLEVMRRSPLWTELALLGVVMLGALVMALRSGNVSNVPGWEVAFRDFVENMLIVRPRTKEFMIGYPALVIYWFTVRKGLIPYYREVLRLAAALAFCSAVNTFCHFHTPLYLSVIRTLNGWWLGLLIGVVCAAALGLALPRLKRAAGVRL